MSAAKKKTAAKRARQGRDLVFGLGSTGLSIARYLRRAERDAVFMDTRDEPPGVDELEELWPDAELVLGAEKLPRDVARIIVSPGIPDHNELLVKARKKKIEIVSDIELFARDAERPFVAVTGSNGKSTVTTLLYHMCRAAGKNVLAGGNLGEPALDLLDEINRSGTTIIMVTHELTLADRARRNLFVRDGEVHHGPPELHFAAAANA